MTHFALQGYSMALWEAGKPGSFFLKELGPSRTLIKWVYDKDSLKYGQVMDFGHCVVNYQDHPAGIVFIANAVIESSAKLRIAQS